MTEQPKDGDFEAFLTGFRAPELPAGARARILGPALAEAALLDARASRPVVERAVELLSSLLLQPVRALALTTLLVGANVVADQFVPVGPAFDVPAAAADEAPEPPAPVGRFWIIDLPSEVSR